MVMSWSCACLALAMLCLPRPPAAGRLRALDPERRGLTGRQGTPACTTTLTAVASALLGGLALGPAGVLAGGAVAVIVGRRRAAHRAARAAEATTAELGDALRRITDELRTGAHPAATLDGVRADGPLARVVLSDAAAAARMGDDVSRALRRAGAERPDIGTDLARVADSWSLAERHGVPLADVLGCAQADLVWRLQYGRRVHAQLAGPRATAMVLTALPGLGLLLGQLLGADPIGVLRDGVLGQVLLVVGIGLAAAGFAWSDRILRSAVPR